MRGCALASRRVVASLATLLFSASACEIEKVAIKTTEALVGAHGVLSATAPSQVVLLERTRNGTIQFIAPPFDLADPVVSDAGVAETGAVVSLRTPGGFLFYAREDNQITDTGKGRGIYRFSIPGSSLERNGKYQLFVLTSKGEVLSGETVMPGGAAAETAERKTFYRATDSLLIEWPASPGARSYYVRIETPFGPRAFFTDSTRVRLTGELRNVDIRSLPRVFIPGWPQAITVSAVDSNFHDWYRVRSDPLSGMGLLNKVSGGFGFFGSLVRVKYQELKVTAPQTEPVAGLFRFAGTPLERQSTPYLALDIFVESPAARADQPDALTGEYEKRPCFCNPGCTFCGLLGTSHEGNIKIAFLRAWSATDTFELFTGKIRGDTIEGSYRGFGGFARFIKKK